MKTLQELQVQFTQNTSYKGVKCVKNPMDLWIYGEIIHDVKPDVIIEIGTFKGGSALWLADHSDAMVISIDRNLNNLDPKVMNDRIIFINGDATNKNIYKMVTSEIKTRDRVLVIEDSAHTYKNTYDCLILYSAFVSINSYYVVEDTICKQLGYGLRPDMAVTDFLAQHNEFIRDESKENI